MWDLVPWPGLLHWECDVLPTEPPEEFLHSLFKKASHQTCLFLPYHHCLLFCPQLSVLVPKPLSACLWCNHFLVFSTFFFNFILLYNTVLVLPYISLLHFLLRIRLSWICWVSYHWPIYFTNSDILLLLSSILFFILLVYAFSKVPSVEFWKEEKVLFNLSFCSEYRSSLNTRMRAPVCVCVCVCVWVTQSYPTLCYPMDYLLEFAQFHVHWVGDAV